VYKQRHRGFQDKHKNVNARDFSLDTKVNLFHHFFVFMEEKSHAQFCNVVFKGPDLTRFHRKIKQPFQMLIKSKATKGLFIADKRLVTKPRYEKM